MSLASFNIQYCSSMQCTQRGSFSTQNQKRKKTDNFLYRKSSFVRNEKKINDTEQIIVELVRLFCLDIQKIAIDSIVLNDIVCGLWQSNGSFEFDIDNHFRFSEFYHFITMSYIVY